MLSSVILLAELLVRPGARKAFIELKTANKVSDSEFQGYRNRAFRQLVEHCYRSVPYYRAWMSDNDLRPHDIQTIEDLHKLPLLTKDIIRREGDRLLSTAHTKRRLYKSRSGGTTGEPIESVLDQKAYYMEYLTYWHGLRRMGYKGGFTMVKLFGGSLGVGSGRSLMSRIRNLANKIHFVPAFELSSSNISAHISDISHKGDSVVIGYASALYHFACLAEQLPSAVLSKLRVVEVFYTAEQMSPIWHQKISKVFGCPIKGFYGCGEINSLGFQLEEQGPYQIPTSHVEIESIQVNGIDNCLAVTALHNYAKPLIRYVNGDRGIIKHANKDERHSYIESLLGRSDDLFMSPDGRTLSSAFAPHVVQKTKILFQQYQLIQLDLHHIEFRYKMESGELKEKEKSVLTKIFNEHLGADVKLIFLETEEFELSKTNKHRIMISKVKHG